MASTDVFEHPLGLGMTHHGYAADCFEVIDFDHFLPFDFRLRFGSMFVELRAVALGLVFGRDPYPDSYSFSHDIATLQQISKKSTNCRSLTF